MVQRSTRRALLIVGTAFVVGCGSAGGSGRDSGEGHGELSAAEREGLAFSREEEKLARDVYAALEDHDPLFAKIGDSEQTHMDAIETLLDRYDVADPAESTAAGDFTAPDLQALHDAFVARGAASRLDALAVGVEIEELDLHDIEALKADATHQDLLKTYDNLARGSRNHLRSFYGEVVSAGGHYTPRHIDHALFEAIVTSPNETGGA